MGTNSRKLRWIVVGGYAAVLIVGSVLPAGDSATLSRWSRLVSPGLQNLLHVPAYAGLVVLAAWPIKQTPHRRLALIALGAAALGAGLEAAQAAIPGRFGSPTDALLNMLGIGLVGTTSMVLRAVGDARESDKVRIMRETGDAR